MSAPEQKVAFITGASRGIGRATALALGRQGVAIGIGYRKERESADRLAGELEALGSRGVPIQLDMGDAEARDRAFDEVDEHFGRLDVFVANAAATAFKPLSQIKPHHVEKTFAITVNGFLFGVQRAAALMEQSGGGVVVGVSGYDCVRTIPRHGVLGAAKAAMEMLAKQFAFELGPKGIRVNCVNFVYADTDSTRFFTGDGHDEMVKDVEALTPLRGLATADDVADAIAYLCSPQSRFVNGQTIMVDGGILLTAPAPEHLPPID